MFKQRVELYFLFYLFILGTAGDMEQPAAVQPEAAEHEIETNPRISLAEQVVANLFQYKKLLHFTYNN